MHVGLHAISAVSLEGERDVRKWSLGRESTAQMKFLPVLRRVNALKCI